MTKMREIKFRAWDAKHQRMTYTMNPVVHAEYNFMEFGAVFSRFYPQGTLEQYTGLKDKNGKEIYEGDILTWAGHYIGDYWQKVNIGKVYYDEGSYDVENSGDDFWSLVKNHKVEIIGNIHENPELLGNE